MPGGMGRDVRLGEQEDQPQQSLIAERPHDVGDENGLSASVLRERDESL